MTSEGEKKVLILGPGPLTVEGGSAPAYTAFRTAMALRREGFQLIGVDSCDASLLSLPGCCDRFYLEPLSLESLEEIIAREKPQGVVGNAAGIRGLYLSWRLARGAVFRGNTQLWGLSAETIDYTLDRALFKEVLMDVGLPTPRFTSALSLIEGMKALQRLWFPLVVRPHFVTGGVGAARICNREEYVEKLSRAISASPSGEVTIEEDLTGWKELLAVVACDRADGCLSLAVFEQLEGAGIHSADSMWIYPPQGIQGELAYFLEEILCRVGRGLGFNGIAEIEILLHPQLEEIYISEAFPGPGQATLFTALVTGIDPAEVNVRLMLGDGLERAVALSTSRQGFPVALRMPYWGEDSYLLREGWMLGMERRSLGEQVVIASSLEDLAEKLKGYQRLECQGVEARPDDQENFQRLPTEVKLRWIQERSEERGLSPRSVAPGFPNWFYTLAGGDKQAPSLESRGRRGNKDNPAIPGKALFLGGEPHHRGRGYESDINVIRGLEALIRTNVEAHLYCNNPLLALVAKDLGVPVHQGPFHLEAVRKCAEREGIGMVVTQFGGDQALALTPGLLEHGLAVPGMPHNISCFPGPDTRQMRLFYHPDGKITAEGEFSTLEEALGWAEEMGYPQLVGWSNPTGSGRAFLVYSREELEMVFRDPSLRGERRVFMQPLCEDGTEILVEALAKEGKILVMAFLENLDDGGSFAEDGLLATPPLSVSEEQLELITEKLIAKLEDLPVDGNIRARVTVKGGSVRLEELRMGASATLPLICLLTGLPLQEWGIKVLFGVPFTCSTGADKRGGVAMRKAILPAREIGDLNGFAFPVKRSTGAVAGMGWDLGSVFAKIQMDDLKFFQGKARVFLSVANRDKRAAVMIAKELESMGCVILATSGTAEALRKGGIAARMVKKLREGRPNVLDLIKNGEVDLIINTPRGKGPRSDGLYIRSAASNYGIPCITSMGAASLLVEALVAREEGRLDYQSVADYQWEISGVQT